MELNLVQGSKFIVKMKTVNSEVFRIDKGNKLKYGTEK
jgi:hypothetical protein